MTIKNGDMPAMPTYQYEKVGDVTASELVAVGLTKRETFCLHMGVAETGDAELDAIISKGNLQEMAMHMMAGMLRDEAISNVGRLGVVAARTLIEELERTK